MEIARNFYRHKLRSALTISGIVIGVLALTTMGALAENFNALLDGGVLYFGSNVQVGVNSEKLHLGTAGVVYGPPLNTRCNALEGPATVRISNIT